METAHAVHGVQFDTPGGRMFNPGPTTSLLLYACSLWCIVGMAYGHAVVPDVCRSLCRGGVVSAAPVQHHGAKRPYSGASRSRKQISHRDIGQTLLIDSPSSTTVVLRAPRDGAGCAGRQSGTRVGLGRQRRQEKALRRNFVRDCWLELHFTCSFGWLKCRKVGF